MPVVLLVHCDGTNSSLTFTDVSPSAHTLTSNSGIAAVDTTNPKFGTGSASFSISVAAGLAVQSTLTDFNFGAGQFTVEAWGYATSTPSGLHGVVTQFGGVGNYGWFLGFAGGALAFYYSLTGTDNPNVGAAYSPTLNTWVHFAADRDASNVLRVYANGVVIASATVSGTFFASTRNCYIGNDENLNRGFPGKLDEIRVVKGQAMYGGAFTPPTAAFGSAAFRNPITFVVS